MTVSFILKSYFHFFCPDGTQSVSGVDKLQVNLVFFYNFQKLEH